MAMHFIIRASPIDDINGKSHKMELISSRNYLTNHIKSKSRHYFSGDYNSRSSDIRGTFSVAVRSNMVYVSHSMSVHVI